MITVFALCQMTQRYRSMSDTKYPRERIFILSLFALKLQLKQGEGCQFYCDQ